MKLRQLLLPNVKLSNKQRLMALSAGFLFALVGGITAFLYFNIGKPEQALALASGDYRSKQSGSWGTATNWEKFNGTVWNTAGTAPTSSDKTINILNGHTMTVAANVTVDQLIVDAGGTLIINDGKTLTLNNGTGTDLDVFGTVQEIGTGSTGALISNASGSIIFESTGKYQHNFSSTSTQGTIPVATWQAGSTCELIGTVSPSSRADNLDQSFSNFTFNCPALTSPYDLAGELTTVNGNFTLTSTGSSNLRLSSGTCVLNIGGDYSQTGGTFRVVNSNGIKDTLNIYGNWSHTGGTLTMGGNASARTIVTFKKAGTQTFSASGNTVTGKVNYIVSNGSTLSMGTSTVLGNDFTMNSGSGLIIGSANGITSSGMNGNVQATGTRNFSTSGNYSYSGTSAQVTGSGLPSTVNNLTINNETGVTLSASVSVSGILTLTSGKISTASFEINSTTTYVVGNLRRSVNTTGTYDFPVGTSTYYELASLKLNSSTGINNILAFFTAGLPSTMPNSSTCFINSSAITGMLNSGYWSITPNNYSVVNYDITLYANGYSNFSGNASQLGVIKRHDASYAWAGTNLSGANGLHSNSNQSISGGIATVKRTSISDFSDFGAGYAAGTLPITLSAFTVALPSTDYALLNWTTSAELNNAFFDVERSDDGINFSTLGKVTGHGTSTVMNQYSFKDESPLTGTSYYRLKQVDFDDQFTYSTIQSLYKSDMVVFENDVNLFPIPATSAVHAVIKMSNSVSTTIELLDISGRILLSKSAELNEGMNEMSFELSEYGAGMYFIRVNNPEGKPVMKRFVHY